MVNINNFIKYCLGYIKLTQQRRIMGQAKSSVELPATSFSISGFLNGDIDGKAGEIINLPTFKKYVPGNVPAELKADYQREKALANKIEDIYNQYENDQFTKQINLSFGYFQIEMPLSNDDEIDPDSLEADVGTSSPAEISPAPAGLDRRSFPLFGITVRIEKNEGDYWIYPSDLDVQVNAGILEPVLGEELYFQLVEKIGELELRGAISIPLQELNVFTQIWDTVKQALKLREAIFDERSFDLNKVGLSLGAKANYFLAEDLQKLSTTEEEKFSGTALNSWKNDAELNLQGEIPEPGDLYFPFQYDKFQLRTLTLLANQASIIQGPPGTGKSETIANLLVHLAATGKKVLFVSQKAQALKVVKDKLKSLEINYLFGYVPNPASPQLNEEDEWDGIAPQLNALEAFVEDVPASKSLTNADSRQALIDLLKASNADVVGFNRAIELQRTFHGLVEEMKEIKGFSVELIDVKQFENGWSLRTLEKLRKLKAERESLLDFIRTYESEIKDQPYKVFDKLDFRATNYSKALQTIGADVSRSAYDRKSRIMRHLNNKMRQLRLGKLWQQLPREIYEELNAILFSDHSRADAIRQTEGLVRNISYRESLHKIDDIKKESTATLLSCGMSEEAFQTIERLLERNANNFESVKTSILRYHQIVHEMQTLRGESSDVQLNTLNSHTGARKKRIAQYVKNIIKKEVEGQWRGSAETRRVIKRLSRAFGKSRKAFKTFDRLRSEPENFKAVLGIIPVWIMELDDASRLIPLEPCLFDYVILDEASQCNVAYTIPVMYRARKSIFVGDSEQMRDSTIMFKSNRSFDELARRYQIPEEMQIKSTGNAVQSVLDIAGMRGLLSVPLRFHYRSPSELIEFSNKHFYKPKGKELIALNSNYLTFGETNRVMLVHKLVPDVTEEISDKTNFAEAKAILEMFSKMREKDAYRNKSIGILTFFNAQATLLRSVFEKAGYNEEKNNFKISIIEGIQGDEKDIIFYSFVIRDPAQKNKYVPLTGEGGDVRADVNRGRVNVAFSRARLQIHCFVSMSIEQIPEKIWIKKFIEHASSCGEVRQDQDMRPFDSYFEEEFYGFTRSKLPKKFLIQNQVQSCGFKIDFVITNTLTGKKVAVECDGPTHFKNEVDEELGIYVQTDEERQRVLEAAGWKFVRIKYSDWLNESYDRDVAITGIVKQLN